MQQPFRLRFIAVLAILSLLTACSRSTPQQPPPPKPPLEFLGEWGTRGNGPGQLSGPSGIATDSVGNVYISDSGSGFIHKFDPLGQPLLSFQDRRIRSPAAITVDSGGAIYVFDLKRNSVLVFYPDGTWLRETRGKGGRPFEGPCRIAVDDEGNLFVLEGRAGRIQKLDTRGRFVKAWGKRGISHGELLDPSGISVGQDGFLYISNTFPFKVVKFTREGDYVTAWGETKAESPAMNSELAVSPKGVFLTFNMDVLEAWTLAGEHTYAFSLRPPPPPVLAPPPAPPGVPTTIVGLTWGRTNNLFALDGANCRVLRFRINL